MRRFLSLAATTLWALGCTSAAPVPSCEERLVHMPPPPDACLGQPEGRAYLQRVADDFGAALLGRQTGPGTAEVTLAFGPDGGVDSVCLGPTAGVTVRSRAHAAAASLRDLPPGPACLVGRRVVLVWESPEVTHEEIMAANATCERASTAARHELAQCNVTGACRPERVALLEQEREERHSSCVLGALPLSIRVPGDPTPVNFRPSADQVPSKERALTALETCKAATDHSALEACMREHGWEPER